MNENRYGFIPDVIDEERDHVFGGLFAAPRVELQPTGQWDAWLPVFEAQNIAGVETMACVSFGTTSGVEVLLRRMFGREENYSERYLSILAETTKQGNSPKKVADAIRHKGLIAQHYLPFDETITSWELFHQPKPMPERYTEIGQKFLTAYDFQYEWLYGKGEETSQEKMKAALKCGPLGAAVAAWPLPRDGIYYKEGTTNHWVTIFGYLDGKYWKIFDSYENAIKHLDWKYEFEFVQRFFIKDLLPKDEADPRDAINHSNPLTVGQPHGNIRKVIIFLVGFIKRIFGLS